MRRLLTLTAFVLLLIPSASYAMVRPVFSVIVSAANTAATRYWGYDSGTTGSGGSGTNNKRTPIGAAGSVSNLYVTLTGSPGAAKTYKFTLYKNGVATALTCTVSEPAASCSDTSDSITVAAGDDLDWEEVPTGTPTARSFSISSSFTGTITGETALSGTTASNNCTTEMYYGPNGGTGSTVTNGSGVHGIAPTSFTIDQLYYSVDAAPGAGNSYILTVMKNDATTTLTTTITGTPATSNSDLNTGHAVSFVAGDHLSFACTVTGAPTGRVQRWGVRLVPAIDGESPLFTSATTSLQLQGTATRFFGVSATMNQNNSTESIAQAPSPINFTLKKMYAEIFPSQAAAHDWKFFSRNNSVNGTLNAIVLSGNTSGNDTSNSDSFSQGTTTLLNWSSVPTITSVDLTYAAVSAVTYIAPPVTATSAHGQLTVLTNGVLKVLNSLFIY